jgi:peptidoglycan/xylan/chitin deacetylase (PgdA/CDA1 family)
MKILGIGRVKRTVHRLQKRLASQKALIFMYHRVAEVDLDPWRLCVTPQHFDEQLQVLKRDANPMSLRQLVQAFQQGKIPDRAVAVTFDDGYADNLYNATPLLEKHGIPATVFITTDYIGQEREFWWDELEQLLLAPSILPDRLGLTVQGKPYEWQLGEAAVYTQADYQTDREYKAWEAQPGSRLFFYYAVWEVLRRLAVEERRQTLDAILAWANGNPATRSTHRILTLGGASPIEIGAHTLTHSLLSAQSSAQQHTEIQQSKATLENWLNRPITSFSYPFGNYNAETVAITQSIGFDYACSTVEDIFWRGSDRFQLPRIAMEDWNGEEFAQQLRRWFHG